MSGCTHSGVTVHFIVPASSINPRLSSTQLLLQFHFNLTSDILHSGSSWSQIVMKMSWNDNGRIKWKLCPGGSRVTPFLSIWFHLPSSRPIQKSSIKLHCLPMTPSSTGCVIGLGLLILVWEVSNYKGCGFGQSTQNLEKQHKFLVWTRFGSFGLISVQQCSVFCCCCTLSDCVLIY